MAMLEWVTMWRAIADGKQVKVPYQLHKGMNEMQKRVFLSANSVCDYFQEVLDAEVSDIKEG